jgi:hypothetical protein
MDTSSSSSRGWRASALIYSGRPDPVTELTADRGGELASTWAELPSSNQPPLEPHGLGYRGVQLAAPDGRTWLAYAGTVTRRMPGSPPVLRADPCRGFERRLLAAIPDDLVPDIPEKPD